MLFAPATVLKLLNVPFDREYTNVRYFGTVAEQTAWMLSRVVVDGELQPRTFARQDGALLVELSIDSCYNINYVMYDNNQIANKYFYCFVTRVEYVSEKVTRLYIKTDVFQTWYLSTVWKPSFVEREHVADDAKFMHTYPEMLETGDYINHAVSHSGVLENLHYFVISTKRRYDSYAEEDASGSEQVNGLWAGLKIISFGESWYNCKLWLTNMSNAGQADAIQAVFVAPSCLYDFSSLDFSGMGSYGCLVETANGANQNISWELISNHKPDSIDGYTPKNNKLFCHPYCHLLVTNNSGNFAKFNFEFFTYKDAPIILKLQGGLSVNPIIRCYPSAYENALADYSSGIVLSGYPLLAYAYSAFQAYLAENAVTLPVTLASSGLSLVAGAATGNPIAIAGGVIGVAGALGQIYERSIQPPQAVGEMGGAPQIGNGKMKFTAMTKTIRAEYAKKIDDFFTMYGYRVNSVKIPAISRPSFNYVKTIGANLVPATGKSVPMDDMEELAKIFDKGVTLWKTSDIGNYDLANGVI